MDIYIHICTYIYFVATHHPSERRDLPDSPEDPPWGPGVCLGNPQGHFVMHTVKTMKTFKRPWVGPRHGG